MVESDSCQTMEELSFKVECPWPSVLDHLRRIGKLYTYRQGIWVSLTETALSQLRTTCASLFTRYQADPFLPRIVIGDEK